MIEEIIIIMAAVITQSTLIGINDIIEIIKLLYIFLGIHVYRWGIQSYYADASALSSFIKFPRLSY